MGLYDHLFDVETDEEALEILKHRSDPFSRGLSHHIRGEYPEAIACYESDLNDVRCVHYLGYYYYHNGNVDLGLQYYRKSAEEDYPLSLHNLGRHYEKIDDRKQAIFYYEQCTENSIDDLIDLYKDDDFELFRLYKLLLKHDTKAYSLIGKLYQKHNKIFEAILYYQQGIALNQPDCYNGLGILYLAQKNYTQALEFLQEYTKLKPIYGYPYLADYYFERKNYPEMIKCYEKAIKLGCRVSHNKLGEKYRNVPEIGDHAKAKYHFMKAVEVSPTPTNFNNLGIAYYDEDDHDNEIKYFMESVRRGYSNLTNIKGSFKKHAQKYPDLLVEFLRLKIPTADKEEVSAYLPLEEILKHVVPTKAFNDQCPICLDLPSDSIVLSCGHLYCKSCLICSNMRKCPCCKSIIC